ncbi:MAG: DUF4160 domain-containing protein [Deltaproteobacteria bacterium]|nr:DUF4160 domain-containing protein [Deltaproteobacteria bacterium]
MPEICRFYGIVVKMFWDDHQPPHFHVEYAGDSAVIAISDFLTRTQNSRLRTLAGPSSLDRRIMLRCIMPDGIIPK